MPSRRFTRKPLEALSDEMGPEDGVDPRTVRREASRSVPNRKALQLCGQVADTLNLVLQGECGDEVLRDLLVTSVVPAPDSTRLLVSVTPTPGSYSVELGAVMEHLRRAYGKLRSEVATAIHRRKTPELLFNFVQRSGNEC
ncbi:MAG: ribosome-binding factor A [Gemmataceae bacterium]